MALADTIGNKQAGELILSDAWNTLVTAVDALTAQVAALAPRVEGLDARLTTVEETVGNLVTRTGALESGLGALRQQVEPLLTASYRVTLRTTRARFALGELAEITAEVRDLAGNPLRLTDATRPWVDFVATWGQLRPADGFETLGDVGDRGISVRTNIEGVARVRLRAEHADGVSADADDDMAATLTTRHPTTGKSVAQMVVEAATPSEMKAAGGFAAVTAQYDRAESIHVRSYVDNYYVKTAPTLVGRVVPPPIIRWRDYRTAVLALVKNDADPLTPDPGRGAASIQVAFRDWIGPWILLDYLPDTARIEADFASRIGPRITANLNETVRNVKDEVNDLVRDKGLVAKQRSYQAARNAMERVTVSQPPAFFNTFVRSMQDAIDIQQAISAHPAAATAEGQEVALEVFTNAAVRADANVAGVVGDIAALQNEVRQVRQGVAAVTGQVSNLNSTVQGFHVRLDTTLAETGPLQAIRQEVNTVKSQVANLTVLNPTEITTRLGELSGIATRISGLEQIVHRG
jgi:hypothetical protein